MDKIEIDRAKYDSFNDENLSYDSKEGVSEELVREISMRKGEPEWMLEKRLKGLKLFQELKMHPCGPSL